VSSPSATSPSPSAPAEVVAVLGANGAARRPTLLAVSGLSAPLGEVLLDGQLRARSLARRTSPRSASAHVRPGRGIFPACPVADNLRMGPVRRRARRQPGTAPRGSSARSSSSRSCASAAPARRHDVRRPAAAARDRPGAGAGARLLLLDEMSMGLSPTVVADLFAIVADLRSDGHRGP
jgi:ABC-type branched-subunit amino acid transport system ATPase component